MTDSDGVAIRPGRPEEAAAIRDLVTRAYAIYLPRMGKPAGPALDDFEARVRDGEAYVLAVGEAIAGALVLIEQDDHLRLDNIAVDPDRQGHG